MTLDGGLTADTVTQTVVVGGLQSLQVPYASFTGVDLTSVFSIEISFDPNLAGDLEVAAPIETYGEPFCGDGTVDGGEQCDDGNAFAGDGCDPGCTDGVCVLVTQPSHDPTGGNADGNSEVFIHDASRATWTQVTNTTAPVQNVRPTTQTGRQILFDSPADLTGGNADGNREILLAEARGVNWVLTQVTRQHGAGREPCRAGGQAR